MNKKFFLFPALALLFALLFSCRNDFLAETEAKHQSELPALTSKIISLNESKHKSKILPELKFAKQTLSNKSENAFGKVVNFGDSISIDTDHVIYMENGTNYHTYTFKIDRINSAINSPLENLIFNPLPDGSYQGFWVVYNLTAADKLKIENKEFIDLKTKTVVTPIENISLSSLSKISCIPIYYSYPILCQEHLHMPGESCAYQGGAGAAYWVNAIAWDCVGMQPYTMMPSEGGSQTGGGGSPCTDCPPSNPEPEPDPCIEIPTSPTQNIPGISTSSGCVVGTPTLPNLGGSPNANTPCENIKELFANPKFKAKFDSLTKPGVFDQLQEKAYVMKYPPLNLVGQVEPAFISIDMPPCSTGDSDAVWPSVFTGITIIMHDHTNADCAGNIPIKAPSPVDIRAFLNKLLAQANTFTGSYLGATSLTTTSGGNYILKYEGTAYPGSISPDQLEELNEIYKKMFVNLYQRNNIVTQADIERVFTKFLKEKIDKPGLNVYRVTPTTTIKLEYNTTSPNSIKETTCS